MLAKNIYIWILIALIASINFTMQFYLNLDAKYQLISWLSTIAIIFLLYITTESFKNLKELILASYNEVKKVVWPTKQETIQTTLIVIVMVSVTGVILWLLDNVMIWLIAKLAKFLKNLESFVLFFLAILGLN